MPIISRCKFCGAKIPYEKNVCQKCMPKFYKQKRNDRKFYDKYIRDKKCTAFYNSKEWVKVREDIKHRDNGLCLLCLQNNRISYSDMIHHLIEIKEDWSKRLDRNNLISL